MRNMSDMCIVSWNTEYSVQEKKQMGRNPFVNRVHWYRDNNEYTGIVKICSSKLWESGIYENWRKNHDLYGTVRMLQVRDEFNNVKRRWFNYYGLVVMSEGRSVYLWPGRIG